ncbi:MAG: flagellar protein FlaG [Gammaproteobacteria bacterium]|nr:flagellar protein FlaG [Gammaproteobacteria bacterium]
MNSESIQGSAPPAVSPARPAPALPATGTAPVPVAPEGKPQTPMQDELSAAVKEIAVAVQSVQRNLNFSIDEASGSTVVKVIDSESDEVIRQFPTEEILALRRRLGEMSGRELSGLLVQTKA